MTAANVWGISGNWAEVYHACFVPFMIAPWAERVLALAALQPGQRLLDVPLRQEALFLRHSPIWRMQICWLRWTAIPLPSTCSRRAAD